MSAKKLSVVTNEVIASTGNTAKNVVSACRAGNERAVSYLDQSFTTAVKKAGTRLNADVRSKAVAAQKKASSLYSKSVTVTSDRAEVVINKAVELAGKGVEQAAANATRFEKATGLNLKALAVAAVPAAQAVSKVAAQVEAKSSVLVNKIAGKQAKVKVAAVKRTVAKKATRAAKKVAA